MEYFLGPHKVLLIYQKLLSYFIFEPVCCFYGSFLIKLLLLATDMNHFFSAGMNQFAQAPSQGCTHPMLK